MYTNKQLTQTGRSRRSYSPEFKAQLVAACRIPGMSVASVARNHGINHNILHPRVRHQVTQVGDRCITCVANERSLPSSAIFHDAQTIG